MHRAVQGCFPVPWLIGCGCGCGILGLGACHQEALVAENVALADAVALACGVWLGVGTPAAAAQGTGYSVTFAARQCTSYSDIFANRFRDDLMQTLQNVGPNSPYGPSDLVNPSFEDLSPQSNCTPLTGWEFTMGRLPDLAPLAGPWGSLTVVNDDFPPVTTEAHTDLLDQDGEPIGNDQIAGATTFELTKEQLDVANQGQWSLRLQGGTPSRSGAGAEVL